jgi:hypothetical protein
MAYAKLTAAPGCAASADVAGGTVRSLLEMFWRIHSLRKQRGTHTQPSLYPQTGLPTFCLHTRVHQYHCTPVHTTSRLDIYAACSRASWCSNCRTSSCLQSCVNAGGDCYCACDGKQQLPCSSPSADQLGPADKGSITTWIHVT